jgi:hypothetical protein
MKRQQRYPWPLRGGSNSIEQPLPTPRRRTLSTPLPRRRPSPGAAGPDPMTTTFDHNVTTRGERIQPVARQVTPDPESVGDQFQLADGDGGGGDRSRHVPPLRRRVHRWAGGGSRHQVHERRVPRLCQTHGLKPHRRLGLTQEHQRQGGAGQVPGQRRHRRHVARLRQWV